MNTHLLLVITKFLRDNFFGSGSFLIEPISKGMENQNFRIMVNQQRYVLRVYSHKHSVTGVRKKSDIEVELDYIEHVKRNGIPTSEVIRNLRGEKIGTISIDNVSHFAVLFDFVEGREAQAYDSINSRLMGELLLSLHKASQTYHYKTVRPWPANIVKTSLDFYRENCEQISFYREKLNSIYLTASERYQQLQGFALPVGIVHGDIKLENVLFDVNRIAAVLDFDDYRESYLLEELTRTLMHDLDSAGQNVIRSGYLNQFLEGFKNDSSIQVFELEQLDTFVKARFLYDITSYSLNGFSQLVEEIFADKYVMQFILS